MTVAADLLEQGEFIANVAHRVGYDNEFAFAKAFKRGDCHGNPVAGRRGMP
jgi:AraC-like DNA-binding protein